MTSGCRPKAASGSTCAPCCIEVAIGEPQNPSERIHMRMQRRTLLQSAAFVAADRFAAMLAAQEPPAAIKRESARPQLAQGVASGDVGEGRAIIWSRCDRPAQMQVEWSTTESFARAAPGAGAGGDGSDRFHGQARPARAAGRAADFLSRAVSGFARPEDLERAGHRHVRHAAAAGRASRAT